MEDVKIKYSDELETLISMAIADGKISESERRLLFRKAIEEGIEQDEFELVLQSRIYDAQKSALSKGESLDTQSARMTMSTSKLAEKLSKARSKEQRANIVLNFPIPTTEADLMEFMMTMSTKAKSIKGSKLSEDEQKEKSAYIAKYYEAVLKAQTFFGNDPRVQNVMQQTQLSAKERKLKDGFLMSELKKEDSTMRGFLIFFGIPILLFLLLVIINALR